MRSNFKKIMLKAKQVIVRFLLTTLIIITLFVSSSLYAADRIEQTDKCEPLTNAELSTSTDIEQKRAVEPNVFGKSYNVVYQFVNDHEYLLAPLSGAVAGGVRCGPWCAAAGGIIGGIDEASIYFGYTDKHYLTWGIFGITTGHAIKASAISDIAGVAVGILLPTGILN